MQARAAINAEAVGNVTRRLVARVVRFAPVTALRSTRIAGRLRSSIRWRSVHARWLKAYPELRFHRGSVMLPLAGRLPREVADANADMVLGVLDEIGVPYTEVRNANLVRRTIAVSTKHREQLLDAFRTLLGDSAVYISALLEYQSNDGESPTALPSGPLARERRPISAPIGVITSAAVVRIWKFYLDSVSSFVLGPAYGCEVEFWNHSDRDDSRWAAPRANVAGDVFSSADVSLIPRKRQIVDAPSSVFDLRMIDDVDFPIDVVYTWVDSSDTAWRRKFAAYSGHALPQDFHEEASGDQRFRSRDELKYSLRSLSMYAPWVRHVYIVTDQQVPEFIDFDHEAITLVDHREIATIPEALPVFNSSAIISWLHRIPGLNEHFIYMNDDVFMGRDVSPAHFFTASGLAKVFPSNNRRPFGKPSAQDEPHINITRNIRALLEKEFGRSISRSVKHTPHAQLVSVQQEMEKHFSEAYDRTSRSRFRHHNDIAADQLFHYYAQITGRAVVGNIRYTYINIGDRRNEKELERLLVGRGRDVFCLNDAPQHNAWAMTDFTVHGFLDAYFPVPSAWERT